MPNNILITPGSASIEFSGSTDNIIRLQVQPLGQVDFVSASVSVLSIGASGLTTTGSITVVNGGVTSSLFGTASYAQTASFFTGSISFPSGLIVTGSILATTVSASSFIGPLTGTASFATSASFAVSSSRSVTSSFALTASAATSITFTPTTSSYATTSSVAISSSFATSASWAPSVGGGITSLTAGDGLTGGTITSTGTITLDTGSAHFLDGVKKELNTEGVISSSNQVSYTGLSNIPVGIVSSSQQINTGSFSGSFTGNFIGTSSWAVSSSRASTASLALTAQTASYFDGFITFPSGLDITGSLIVTGSQTITGSLNATGGITGSLLGSSSFATTASFAISASWAPSAPGGGITSLTAGDGLTGGTITSTGTITLDTGSVHFLDGVKKELNTEGVVSSSTFSSPSQGTVRTVINGVQTDVDTGLQTGDSPQFTNLNVSTALTASIVSASTAITASHVQLNGLTDTTQTNKVLVINTVTNKIFTTSSVGGGSGNGFPYNGTVIPAVISGSLLISSSINSPLIISGSVNEFFELEVVNASAGNNASSDVVVSSNDTTDFGNYAAFGINSTTYNGGLVGGPSDGYIYLTSSVGELHVGHAATTANSNVRLFAGGPSSDATTRIFISASGNVGIGATTNLQNRLTVNGSVSASSVTSSFTGSFTGALTHFNPSTLKLTVGTTAPSSPAVNDLWVDTN